MPVDVEFFKPSYTLCDLPRYLGIATGSRSRLGHEAAVTEFVMFCRRAGAMELGNC